MMSVYTKLGWYTKFQVCCQNEHVYYFSSYISSCWWYK